MYRPRTKPQTGKRKRKSAARAHCQYNPNDPSCYYPGKNNQFVNGITGQLVDSGCIGGNRQAAGNPRDCDFRKVDHDTVLGALPEALSKFNRARIQYADSQALIKKYSPFRLDASGWPDIPGLTTQQCQNPTQALINQLAARIKPDLWNAGVRIWVDQRAHRLKCVRGMPSLRYPPGMAARNRYFQMGVSYANSAASNLFQSFGIAFLHDLAEHLEPDEAAATAYVVQHDLVWDGENSSPIRQWRRALRLLRPRREKRLAAEPDLAQQIQEAAAAAAMDQEILALAADLQAGAEN